MAPSDVQGFFGQLFPRRAFSSGKAVADVSSLTEEVAFSRSTAAATATAVGSQIRALPAGVPPAGPPWPFHNGTQLSFGVHEAQLEHLRDTGDPNEQLCAEYKLQTLRHTERFSSLMERVRKAQRQREAQVDKVCETTRTAFDAARALREKEALDLRETLERNDECARESLRDRVLQQCDRHNLLAQRGVEACMRFAETVLSGEIEIGRNVLARVRSQVDREGPLDSETVSDSAHTRLSVRVREALTGRRGGGAQNSSQPTACSRHDTPLPLSTRTRRPSRTKTFELADLSLEESKPDPTPSPPLPIGPPPDGEPPLPSTTQDIQPSDAGLLEVFATHFADIEKQRERQWRQLQEQHDADLGIWRNRYRELLASLASEFASEDAPGGSRNAVKAADKADRASARETVSHQDWWREYDMERLWRETKTVFVLHHDAFIERLRAAERGLESNDYTPAALVPPPPRGAAFWIPASRRSMQPYGHSLSDSPTFRPPFSLASLLTLPRISRGLPTVAPRLQMRTAFWDAQAQRDRRFEATFAAFEEESQAAEHKHEMALATELRSWRNQADTAERERAALFSLRIKVAREGGDLIRSKTL